MQLQEIKEIADNNFERFLEFHHKYNPELILKYGLNIEMKDTFVEMFVLMYWAGQSYNENELLKLIHERFKYINR